MQKSLILTFLIICSYLNILNAQEDHYLRPDIVKLLDSKKDSNPIEGVWSLNVLRTLVWNDTLVIGQEVEENRSQWAILKDDDRHYRVSQVIDSADLCSIELEDINAWFSPTENPDSFQYVCHFYDPNWVAEATAFMDGDSLLIYQYFASDEYVQDVYDEEYVPGLKLHWFFLWEKEYPLGSALIKL